VAAAVKLRVVAYLISHTERMGSSEHVEMQHQWI